MATLSTANKNALQYAIDEMVKESAVELPVDATVAQHVADVAASTGFQTQGAFMENVKNRPISTLLAFVKFIGT